MLGADLEILGGHVADDVGTVPPHRVEHPAHERRVGRDDGEPVGPAPLEALLDVREDVGRHGKKLEVSACRCHLGFRPETSTGM
jgi:hypothetical protein